MTTDLAGNDEID